MKICLVYLALLVGLSSCSIASSKELQTYAKLDIPAFFQLETPWALVMLDKNDQIVLRMIVVFTSAPADACGGDFKRMEVLEEYPERSGAYSGSPAYHLQGRELSIDLAAPICDAHYDLIGKITENGIVGTHGPVSPWGGEILGKFYAVPALGN